MNDITVFIYGICFALTAGAAFAFMWKSMGAVILEMEKYVDRDRPPIRKRVHPEMKDVNNGDELLVFKKLEDPDDK